MFNFFEVSADKLRGQMLDKAEVDLLESTRAAEHYTAMTAMLSGRVTRLRAEVEDARIAKRTPTSPRPRV